MPEMQPQYSAPDTEKRWHDRWIESKVFSPEPDDKGNAYTIVIPPPNVTGILHMGHALNNTIQDILMRWRRMEGRKALWVPGTDHAGIATQNVVEKRLAEKGIHRDELGRETFLEEVWKWKEEYGSTIIRQLKRLGCSCDWDRLSFTMDEGLSKAVLEAFKRLYNKGLIYQGNYIINWCPRCTTALSDEEAEHEDTQGKLYHIRYPLEDKSGQYITVATTRPETMLGDTGVAVNPKDKRYKAFTGKYVILPIIGRRIPVVTDEFVDMSFGTGAVKVTPAHDPNDFDMGKRHDLEFVNVMNPDGTMNEHAGAAYKNMDRMDCRKKLVKDLDAQGLLEKVEQHGHAVRHCYRCHTMVEPRLSKQWFVRMKPLAEPAIEAVKDGRITFYPKRWTKVYMRWMENIRDWCISRQIWWGHRIPVWQCAACEKTVFSAEELAACPECGSKDIAQDSDVLDTWFSSWLWPFSTLGWPEKTQDRACFYPTNDLVTAQEIIFFWVARMIMAGIEFAGDIPFSSVYIHGTVRDETGRKMSKSLGNIIDPLEIIDTYGADALRYSLIAITAQGQDVFLSHDKFESGRNFSNKIWNASRFLMTRLEGSAPAVPLETLKAEDLSRDDAYIIHTLNATIKKMSKCFELYRFNEAVLTAYDFFWHSFCDRYIEYAKNAMEDESRAETVKAVLVGVLGRVLKLLHPVMPFITEEIWHILETSQGRDPGFIACEQWPQPLPVKISKQEREHIEARYAIVRSARSLKKEFGLQAAAVDMAIRPGAKALADVLADERDFLKGLLKTRILTIDPDYVPAKKMPNTVTEDAIVYLRIEGALDVQALEKKHRKRLEKIAADVSGLNKKLKNINFLEKAPKDVVDKEKERLEILLEERHKIEETIAYLA